MLYALKDKASSDILILSLIIVFSVNNDSFLSFFFVVVNNGSGEW